MAKTLKIWNGRGHGKYIKGYIYVAAYSKKQAAELISTACDTYITATEITDYYSEGSWSNSMSDIIPTEPCVYATDKYYATDKPIRIL